MVNDNKHIQEKKKSICFLEKFPHTFFKIFFFTILLSYITPHVILQSGLNCLIKSQNSKRIIYLDGHVCNVMFCFVFLHVSAC